MAPDLRRLQVDTRPLKHPDFRNLWLGQAVSTLGAEIGTVAIPYQVYTLTHSTALVGLLGLASLLPLLVIPLIGGAIADALDRRTVLLCTETGLTVVAALFLVNSLLPHPQVWLLFVLQSVAVAVRCRSCRRSRRPSAPASARSWTGSASSRAGRR